MSLKKQSMKRQAALITGSGVAVRAMGFFMRLWISRMLGAEAVGIMELSAGVHGVMLTPAAGLPGAVSRMTARAKTEGERRLVLAAGRGLALRMALWIMPIFLLFSPGIARLLGDERTLPSLWCFAPCVLFIGLSGVYDGFYLGKSNALPPTVSELGEQIVRMGALAVLSPLLGRVTAAWRAALPAAAGMLGEAAGLALAAALAGGSASFSGNPAVPALRAELWALSAPMMLNRLVHTGLRALSNLLIPRRLMLSGLSAGESMSRLGMLGGMVMPLMFLPGLLAGSLAAVGGPAAARCADPRKLRLLLIRMLLPAALAGVCCAAGLYAFAPLIALRLYRLPELAALIRALCPLAVILPCQQALSGLMTGLGLQKRALRHGLLGAGVTLLCTYCWTYSRGILGAGFAMMAGHGLTLFCTLVCLIGRIFSRGQRMIQP